MSASVSRRDLARIDREAREDADRIRREHPGVIAAGARGPRCRICSHQDSREMVNRMLSHAMSYQSIFESCRAINAHRPKNSQISYDAVRWHAKHHFNIQEPAKALWRQRLEKRKAQYDQDEADMLADGVENLLTVFGYLDVLGQKGFQNLISEETAISPELGMNAMLKLHELTKKGAGEAEALEMRRQVGLLQQAVREVVPEEYWNAIRDRITEAYSQSDSNVVDAEVVNPEDDDYGFDDDDKPFSPTDESDPDDSFED